MVSWDASPKLKLSDAPHQHFE